jgi:hypothetical protein
MEDIEVEEDLETQEGYYKLHLIRWVPALHLQL